MNALPLQENLKNTHASTPAPCATSSHASPANGRCSYCVCSPKTKPHASTPSAVPSPTSHPKCSPRPLKISKPRASSRATSTPKYHPESNTPSPPSPTPSCPISPPSSHGPWSTTPPKITKEDFFMMIRETNIKSAVSLDYI